MTRHSSPHHAFPIVGVGASAGGIEALEGFFRGVPRAPGFAVVIVTHLSPDRESRLHEIVGRHTNLPVHVAADGQRVERDAVYVLPADAVLGIEDGRLRLHRPNGVTRERKPIDVFFAALAADQGESAAGIVLSGDAGDGTLGVKAIKERGGLTLAQVTDDYGPRHASMPETAIAGGFVDLALPVEAMGGRLADFARGLHVPDSIAEAATGGTTEAHVLEEARAEIYGILRNQTGHDFGGYKPKSFLRRVQRRIQMLQLENMDGYLEQLRQSPEEVNALFRDLLINVTSFFRDANAFDALARLVIPRLLAGRGAEDTVRVWVPGCATGEEVFSLGILLREAMDGLAGVPRVQIFATDIDEHALAVARAARYPAALLDGVTEARRRRFFVPDAGSHIVAKEVRDLCIFSPHSVIRDPPFSRIDLISCRNLLIYLGPEVQNEVMPVFHYALRPDGYLFLGTAETIGQFSDLFSPLDKKHRLFRRRTDMVPAPRLPAALAALRGGQSQGQRPRQGLPGMALRQTVEGQVLERFAPPFVVVNRDGNIVFFSARTGRYLEATPGMPSRQLLTMARRGLRLDLRTVAREAVETGRRSSRSGVIVESDEGRTHRVTLTAEPLRDQHPEEPLTLVVFGEEAQPLAAEKALTGSRAQEGAARHLAGELRETRERLQSLIEEYEAALEELKGSNEELVSVNEELQSSNEELEASKEELQSVNEELQTLNAELISKVDTLDRTHGDLQTLFDSTDVATVFLDEELLIRSFTPAVAKVFNVLPGDRGRPITDLASRLNLPDLAEDVAVVLAGGEPIERRAHNRRGDAYFLVRITPYRNVDQQIRGIVISFVDITGLTLAENGQRVLISELHHRTRNLLTVVQAISTLTLGKGGTLKSFTDRLSALGRVQGLVSRQGAGTIDFGEIVRLELTAHATPDDGRITVAGPKVELTPERVQVVALALHELVTNAMKYGALKHDAGRLSIAWRIEKDRTDGPTVVLDWRETGVPMPAEPPRSGYGRQLIERALSHTLGAQAAFSFEPDGVRCRVEVPLQRRSGWTAKPDESGDD